MPVLSPRMFLPRNVQDKHRQFLFGLREYYLRPVKDLHRILSVNVRR